MGWVGLENPRLPQNTFIGTKTSIPPSTFSLKHPNHHHIIAQRFNLFNKIITTREDLEKAVAATSSITLLNLDVILPTTDVGHVLITGHKPNTRCDSKNVPMPEKIDEEESMKLFIETSKMKPENLTAEDKSNIRTIIRLVDQFPLAISSIGASMLQRRITVEYYANHLSDDPGRVFDNSPLGHSF
ncbi:hypothetical protein BDD12DRAFT_810974 [Trichophaea hybrida]|nr:hypothetical protein BDD12DRAFT_810974 [Trichophaea hybrida]